MPSRTSALGVAVEHDAIHRDGSEKAIGESSEPGQMGQDGGGIGVAFVYVAGLFVVADEPLVMGGAGLMGGAGARFGTASTMSFITALRLSS